MIIVIINHRTSEVKLKKIVGGVHNLNLPTNRHCIADKTQEKSSLLAKLP